jgi:hypothetical protein
MIARERIETILNRVRPFLQADGGDIQLLSVEGNSADVRGHPRRDSGVRDPAPRLRDRP